MSLCWNDGNATTPTPVSLCHTLLQSTSGHQGACYVNMCEAAAVLRRAVNASEDEVVDVKVTCNATWQKRGHQSLYGVVVVASWETGQVLDIEVLSKY